ncbi:hypothetical protein JCM18897A_59850 [Streptomyces sp. JCM 18897]
MRRNSATHLPPGRSAILNRIRDNAVADLRAQLDSLGPGVPLPPRTEGLQNLTLQLGQARGAHTWRTSGSRKGGPLTTFERAPAQPSTPQPCHGYALTVPFRATL